LAAGTESLASEFGLSDAPEPFSGRELEVLGPADGYVSDAQGNILGHEPSQPEDAISEEIPGGTYQAIDETQTFFLNEGGSYNGNLKITGDRGVRLRVRDYAASEIVGQAVFEVDAAAGAKVGVDFTNSQPLGDLRVEVDQNNDGTIDESLAPDSVVSGPASSETDPPRTTTVVKALGGGRHEVTLSAWDGPEGSGVASIHYFVEGGQSEQIYSGPFTVAGGITVYFYSVDKAGNAEPLRKVTVNAPTIDLTASSDSGSSSTDDMTNDATPALTGNAEANSTVKVYDDTTLLGSTNASAAGSWSFTPTNPLADGVHPFKATFTDTAANISIDSVVLSVTVDTTAPDTTIDSGPSGSVGANPPAFTFSTEADSTFDCSLDGVAYAGCVSPKSYTGLTDGSHTFRVRAQDKAGNVDSSPAQRTFTVDTVAPTVAGKTPASGATGVPRDASVVVTFSEAVKTESVRASTFTLTKLGSTTPVDATVTYDGAANKATFDPTNNLDSEATYTARVKGGASGVKDLADNPLAADSSWTFTVVDYTPPTVTSVSPASGATGVPLATNVSAAFSEGMNVATISGSTFTLVKQGTTTPIPAAPPSYNSATKEVTLDPTNSLSSFTTYVATVKGGTGGVKDKAGNPLGNDKTWSFTTADTVAPNAPTIDLVASSDTGSSSTDNLTNDTTPTLSGNAEAGSTVKIKDGTTQIGTVTASSTGTWIYSPATALTGGKHLLSATATDAAGNQSVASATLTVTVDTTAPTATLPSHALKTNTQLSASEVPVDITWPTATDANGVDHYELRESTDGGNTFTNVTLTTQEQTNRSYAAMLAPGTTSYRFGARAVDNAGNGSWSSGGTFSVGSYPETGGSVSFEHQASNCNCTSLGWQTANAASFFGGSSMYASDSSNTATLTLTNTKQVGWVTAEGPQRGKAKVSLYQGTTLLESVTRDTYATSAAYRQMRYVRSGLDPTKTYKLVVEVLGTKNASSTGTRVDVDSFVIIR